MERNVVEMDGKPHREGPPPASDYWFAQVDVRLGRIEFMVTRLEWQVWLIVCGCAGLLVFEIVNALSGASS